MGVFTESDLEKNQLLHTKKMEKVLQESERKYFSLYSTMSEGVALRDMIYDESGKLIVCSKRTPN